MCTAEKVQEALGRTIEFLKEHQNLIDCHVVDFLWDNHWGKLLSPALREELDANRREIIENIKDILSGNCPYEYLGEFLENAKNHSLASFDQTTNLEDFLPEEQPLKVTDFMTPKKMHEVKSASRLVSWLCSKSRSPIVVVDAGDGKGYLSSCLAFEYNLPVIGLEANADYQKSAKNRIAKLKKKWKIPDRENNYKSVAVTVTSDLRLSEISQDVFSMDVGTNFCLSGLHTCGDLAVSCLEIFTRDPHVRYLCNIGCCYNLLSKFPVSTFLSHQNFLLSDRAKMLACQSLNRILEGSLPKNSLHYRTFFEQLVKEKYPSKDFEQLGKIKCNNFIEYFKLCCEKMNLQTFYSDEEIDEKFSMYDRKNLDIFYVIRSSIAAAIEAVIILDRVLFVIETSRESKVHLIKLFHQDISPRCYAIVAEKLP